MRNTSFCPSKCKHKYVYMPIHVYLYAYICVIHLGGCIFVYVIFRILLLYVDYLSMWIVLPRSQESLSYWQRVSSQCTPNQGMLYDVWTCVLLDSSEGNVHAWMEIRVERCTSKSSL